MKIFDQNLAKDLSGTRRDCKGQEAESVRIKSDTKRAVN